MNYRKGVRVVTLLNYISPLLTFLLLVKNLLGEAEYQRLLESLKPGEHALMVFNRGTYSYVSENFIPQTVPARLSIVQGDVSSRHS